MQSAIQKVRLRALMGVLAVVVVAAAIWATAALAGGGSADSSDPVTSQEPSAAFTQEGGDGSRADDCPEREGEDEEGDDASADV